MWNRKIEIEKQKVKAKIILFITIVFLCVFAIISVVSGIEFRKKRQQDFIKQTVEIIKRNCECICMEE